MLKSLEVVIPLSEELLEETGKIWARVFLPTIVFDGEKVKKHAKRAKEILERMGV